MPLFQVHYLHFKKTYAETIFYRPNFDQLISFSSLEQRSLKGFESLAWVSISCGQNKTFFL
jgi:hypothetical protein